MTRVEFLKLVRKQIHYVFIRSKIEKEFDQHLDDAIDCFMSEGYSKEEAELKAVQEMGDATLIGKQLNKIHQPFLGYLLVMVRIAFVILLFNFLTWGNGISYYLDGIDLFFPYNRSSINSDFTLEPHLDSVDMHVVYDLPGHKIILDEVSKLLNGDLVLGYRVIYNLEYSRVHNSNNIAVINEEGKVISGQREFSPSSSIFGRKAHIHFPYPKKDIIQLQLQDESIVEFNIGEYLP